ncbi:TrbG/VirB9 family P-type conjugative transfer protein, partial [Klebsiella pneumoniae]
MSSGNFFSPAGLSAAATILLTLPGQVQASAENYQYQMKFSADAQSIRPTTVFDDGKATWFVIPSDPKSPPAILIVTPDGKEKLPERYVTAPNGHCCKVSDEAAFCLIQRPYISKT